MDIVEHLKKLVVTNSDIIETLVNNLQCLFTLKKLEDKIILIQSDTKMLKNILDKNQFMFETRNQIRRVTESINTMCLFYGSMVHSISCRTPPHFRNLLTELYEIKQLLDHCIEICLSDPYIKPDTKIRFPKDIHELKIANLKVVHREENNIRRFSVALSFPGEHRQYVQSIAEKLRDHGEKVFYDKFIEYKLARPNLDVYLQEIYRNQSDLIAVFLCQDYERKEWCGLEWRAIRDLIKSRHDEDIMPFRFDNTTIPGFYSVDGYIDLKNRTPDEAVDLILQRLKTRS